MFVATLIGPQATTQSGTLTQGMIEETSDLLADAGCAVQPARWLDTGQAADIYFTHAGDERNMYESMASASKVLSSLGEKLDYLVQMEEHRQRKLFLSDMDSTIIGQECIDELADFAGLRAEITAITDRAMAGELDFGQSLHARVEKLAGLDETVIEKCLAERIRPNPGARTLIATLQHFRIRCLLVSGGFHHFADPIGDDLGFDGVHANHLEVADGKLTGKVIPPVFDAEAKASTLHLAAQSLSCEMSDALAVGDGANDLPMLELAGLSVGYHAKPVVQQSVDMAVRHNDLTVLLYALGLDQSQWQTPD